MRRLLIYLLRWQMSTPILAVITYHMAAEYGSTISAIVANLVGGLLFYHIDKRIFKK